MSERIRGSYDNALYKSTYSLLFYFTLPPKVCPQEKIKEETELDHLTQVYMENGSLNRGS